MVYATLHYPISFPLDMSDCMHGCVYFSLHSQYVRFLIKPSAVEHRWKSESESIVYENFILTVSLFGVISGVYCECRLTCHCVWRCVTVLEYILVRCESVCGCINVCRAPPASLCQNWLTEESVLQNRVALCRTPAVLQLKGPERLPISWLAGRCWALQLHACVPLLLNAIRHSDNHSERGLRDGKQPNHWWWCGRAMRVVAK